MRPCGPAGKRKKIKKHPTNFNVRRFHSLMTRVSSTYVVDRASPKAPNACNSETDVAFCQSVPLAVGRRCASKCPRAAPAVHYSDPPAAGHDGRGLSVHRTRTGRRRSRTWRCRVAKGFSTPFTSGYARFRSLASCAAVHPTRPPASALPGLLTGCSAPMQYFPAGRAPHVSNDNVAHVLLRLRPSFLGTCRDRGTYHARGCGAGTRRACMHLVVFPNPLGIKRTVDSSSIHKYI